MDLEPAKHLGWSHFAKIVNGYQLIIWYNSDKIKIQFPVADFGPVKYLGQILFAKIGNGFKAIFQLTNLLKYSLTYIFNFSLHEIAF